MTMIKRTMMIIMMMTTRIMVMMMMTWWFGGWGWAIYNTLVGAAEGRRPTSGGRLSFMATHGMEIHGHDNMEKIQICKKMIEVIHIAEMGARSLLLC